ncbi:RNA polymerase sigma factor SigJ [Paractinoplanes durhamensis]|uniref:RNA polymerase sigma24 factor n=1 Tax=Paractinoplanes durhamensis TaxID=113563 RepID=A0ABQ3Z6R5_9ACTN|nr:RNA polymerase sigma factor SigJ [Actinoplanes durhamensis]GIE05527.1 RNA polymerase sigma24 factor [Actinoplanes durhamensis]
MSDLQRHRALLFQLAYRMTGSVADAEDVVQETWLRWHAVDPATVRDPRAYLVRTATRLAIDHLRRERTRREAYIGPWLPEPLASGADEPVERAESVSMAVLVLLETLSPLERAVFLLRDVFEFGYPEVAEAVGRGEPAVRQLAARARAHVRAGRPRYTADPDLRRLVTDRFLQVCLGGDLAALMAVLAPDVALWADANGSGEMPRVVLHGVAAVVEFFRDSASRYPPGLTARAADLNGGPAGVLAAAGEVFVAVLLDLDEQGRVAVIRLIRNPAKLTRLS